MTWTIHPLVTARLHLDCGRMTYLRNYGRRLVIPSAFFALLGGPEPVLVDTSGSAEVMGPLRAEPVEEVRDFETALAKAGLKPEDIGTVIQTHLMYDHCANSKSIPRARFVVQKRELEFARNPHPMYAGVYQPQLFEGLNFQVVDGDVDLLPGIKLILSPGHTPGVQSVAVETPKGLAVITGFCCLAENFTFTGKSDWTSATQPEVVPPGIHLDMRQAFDSAVRVKRMADIIVAMHDLTLEGTERIPG